MRTALFSGLLIGACCLSLSFIAAQPPEPSNSTIPETASNTTEAEEQTIIVERQAMKLIDPERYQLHFKIIPSQYISIIAPRDGVISEVSTEPGQKTRLAGRDVSIR